MSPLEGYREQHEYQTFSLQSCAAYFHSLNVLMKHSCSCPAWPSTAIKSVLRETYLPRHQLTSSKCSEWKSLSALLLVWSTFTPFKLVCHGFLHQTQKEMLECLHSSFTYKESKVKDKKQPKLVFKSVGSVKWTFILL